MEKGRTRKVTLDIPPPPRPAATGGPVAVRSALPRTACRPGAQRVEKGRTRKVTLDVLPPPRPPRPGDRSRSSARSPPDRAPARRAARGKGRDAPSYPRRPSPAGPAATGGPVAVRGAPPGPRAVPARSAWKRAGRAKLPSTSLRLPARCDRRTGRGPARALPPRTARRPGAQRAEKGGTRKVTLDVLAHPAPLRPEDRSRSGARSPPDRATSRRGACGKGQAA